jgi:DNA-binding transcriptional regulator YhcF (GntR family)
MYLQLIEQVRHAIELGALRPGDQLPGIRKVAEDLVMNPNTVAKAYREMEHAGLVVLRHGAGAFVAENDRKDQGGGQRNMQKGRAVVHRAVAALRELDLDDGAIRRLLESELAEINEEVHR